MPTLAYKISACGFLSLYFLTTVFQPTSKSLKQYSDASTESCSKSWPRRTPWCWLTWHLDQPRLLASLFKLCTLSQLPLHWFAQKLLGISHIPLVYSPLSFRFWYMCHLSSPEFWHPTEDRVHSWSCAPFSSDRLFLCRQWSLIFAQNPCDIIATIVKGHGLCLHTGASQCPEVTVKHVMLMEPSGNPHNHLVCATRDLQCGLKTHKWSSHPEALSLIECLSYPPLKSVNIIGTCCVFLYAKRLLWDSARAMEPKTNLTMYMRGMQFRVALMSQAWCYLHHPSKPSNAQFDLSMYWRSVFWKWRDIHIYLCHCSCFGIFKRAMNTMTLFVLVLISQSSNPSSRPVGLGRSLSATLYPCYSTCFLSRLRKCHLKSSMCFCG